MQKGDNLFPQIKKSIKSFLLNEDGKISKETLLTIGSLLGIAAFGLSERVSASHLCQPGDPGYSGGSCSCGGEGCEGGGCSGGGCGEGCGCGGSEGACFPAGTKITIANSSTKNIEDIRIGDLILAYDTVTSKKVPARVLELDSKIRRGYYLLNNSLLKVTDDHPIYTRKMNGVIQWCSINPIKSIKTYKIGQINQLEIADEIFTIDNGWTRINSIKYINGDIYTYTLKNIEGYNAFFANGILVLKSDAVPLEKEIMIEA